MKTIEQLLALSKNPYYNFNPEEEQRLNDFLSKKQESQKKSSQKKSSTKSEDSTPATATDDEKNHKSDTVKIRNVVEKTIPKVEESGK